MNRTDAFLGLDVGGTGAKAGVFDCRGRLLGLGREAYAPTQTPDGRAAQRSEEHTSEL